jgi:hypothetical protein
LTKAIKNIIAIAKIYWGKYERTTRQVNGDDAGAV